jgi:hypothetical protein
VRRFREPKLRKPIPGTSASITANGSSGEARRWSALQPSATTGATSVTTRERGLYEKTIGNAIDGSLRAMVRDAEQEDIGVSLPFTKVRWPHKIVPAPSPFMEAERDQILNYFGGMRWKAGRFNDTRPRCP